jgi:hypothetical protein
MSGKFTASFLIIVSLLFLVSTSGSISSLSLWSVEGQSSSFGITPLTSYRVNGSPNYSDPGGEQFWGSINWTTVPLAASVSPGGGHTPDVLVKSANTGYDIYMLLRWNVTAGPSFLSDTEVFKASNGSLIPLTPALTANVTQLFYNSTYYYPDRAAILWFIAPPSERQQSPRMMLGSDGAITGGAAEIWHWQSNPTDNSPNDTGFPGGYTDPSGKPIYPPDNLSFAEDDYTNSTGFFVIGGSFGVNASNLDPYADPFIVHVGSLYSSVNKTWTVEMVRAFTTSDAGNYRVQLRTGSSYFIAMAVWQGRMGESSQLKSVSQWYNLTISAQGTASKSTASISSSAISAGITTGLAAAVAVSALIVGLVIGTIVRGMPRTQKVGGGG